jgi:hypothetical protein
MEIFLGPVLAVAAALIVARTADAVEGRVAV